MKLHDLSTAVCIGSDADFFPRRPDRGHSRDQMQAYLEATMPARALCWRCPVINECLEEQLANTKYLFDDGIWGGTDPYERKVIRAERALPSTLAG